MCSLHAERDVVTSDRPVVFARPLSLLTTFLFLLLFLTLIALLISYSEASFVMLGLGTADWQGSLFLLLQLCN